ncbi:MAG: signal peptidase I [Coriobacteriia bacterium]|nr:signal peptidase I [Coriobacteriia bacterium]
MPRRDLDIQSVDPDIRKYPAQTTVWQDLKSLVIKIAAIAVITALLFTFVFGLHYTVEPSMNPAIQDGDLVLFYRLDKNYVPGDLAVLDVDGERQVRRVIARQGDEIDITEAGLMLNGANQQERQIFAETQRYETGVDFPLTVGAGEIFVLGDAREGVTDSRAYGTVHESKTKGTAIALLRRRSL